MSSSIDQAVVAVSWRRVGVDIERICSGFESLKVARDFFSPREFVEIQTTPVGLRNAAFFQIWTRKEAFVKALGLRLQRDLTSFDVLMPAHHARGAGQALVIDREAHVGDVRWLVHDVPFQSDFALACCAEGEDWSIVHQQDDG